jgi:S1-C subfamily serine protease
MNVAEAVDRIRPSVVQIGLIAVGLGHGVRNQGWRPFIRRPLGTGFLVNPDGHVITARHVVEQGHQLARQIQASSKEMLAGLAIPNTENMRGNFSGVPFDVVAEDALHDLALLKLRANPFRGEVRSGFVVQGEEVPLPVTVATLNPRRPRDGDAVGVSGYPLGQPVLVSNVGWMATSWSFEIEEVAVPGAPESFLRPEVADTFLADLQANPGNSGGPVYLTDSASVIGVCVGSMPSPVWDEDENPATIDESKLFYSAGLTVVVPVRYVIDLLREHELNWSE